MKKPSREQLDKIRQTFNLQLILLYGSRTEGYTHNNSDIDIAVLGKKPLNSDSFLQLQQRLAAIFENDTIDLVDLNTANPLLLKSATDACQILSGHEEDLNALQLKALHLYNDYLPYLKLEDSFVSKHYDTHQN